MKRHNDTAPEPPPPELESWMLFASLRGYYTRDGYDETRLGEWIAARQEWEAEHGLFPDGEESVASREPSGELVDFEAWCDRRGVPFHLATGENTVAEFAERAVAFRAWCDVRSAFAATYGWRGGKANRRREETAAEPFDLSSI
jgi:hypothetical protein